MLLREACVEARWCLSIAEVVWLGLISAPTKWSKLRTTVPWCVPVVNGGRNVPGRLFSISVVRSVPVIRSPSLLAQIVILDVFSFRHVLICWDAVIRRWYIVLAASP